jgi:hypothetical protein
MATTYVKIATATAAAGGSAFLELTSIPSTYTDLMVKLSCRSTGTGDLTTYVDMVINSDTGAYYDHRNVSGMLNGTVTNQTFSNQNAFYVYQIDTDSATTSTYSNTEIYLPNYTSTTSKSISVDGAAESNTSASANRGLSLVAGLYHPASNVAINALKFTASGGNFKQYSTIILYGISKS